LTEYSDVFDRENSVYTRSQYNPDYIENVEEYAFNVPSTGLPPLFRVASNPTVLFVSSQARNALRKAKIAGPRYISLCGYRHDVESDWVDIQILPDEGYFSR
jgi:hypothetical protein